MRIKSLAVAGVTGAVFLMGFAACRSATSGGTGGSATGGSGTGGTGGSATGGTGGNGTGGNGTGGNGTGGNGTGGNGTGGNGTGGADGGGCTGSPATIKNINTGVVGLKQNVELTDVVATSQKFLASASKKSGSCLWAMFVTAAGQTTVGESTSIMLVSYGTPATTTDGGVGKCQSGTDAIPDNVKPGDKLHVFGQTDAFAPSTCTGTAPVKENQVRVSKSCKVTSNGTATVPKPYVLDIATADKLAAGTDQATLNKWGGALVELQNVTAAAADGGGIVGPYGVITFTGTQLEAHDKIIYYDLSGTGPKDKSKAWVYGSATTFKRIDGLAYLDYCTWSLNPRNKCTDLDPASEGCTPDGGP